MTQKYSINKFAECPYNKQVIVRRKMANLTYIWKVLGGVLKGAFEHCHEDFYKDRREIDVFKSMNLRGAMPIFLTKEMSERKCEIVAPYFVSEGTMTPVGYVRHGENSLRTNIKIGDVNTSITDTDSYFNLCDAIVGKNKDYDGRRDSIVFIGLVQKYDETTKRHYAELVHGLMPLSYDKIKQMEFNSGISIDRILPKLGLDNVDGYLGIKDMPQGGFAWIHVRDMERRRKDKSRFHISRQQLFDNNQALTSRYSSYEAFEAAARSYGDKPDTAPKEEKVEVRSPFTMLERDFL